jgi:divalent metal cation (Fe/Co/Zn/Cd) transporter
VAIVGRFRSGDPLLRAQVKWLAAIVVVAAISVLAGLLAVEALPVLGSAFTIVGVLALALMPLAIGVAILRYRLYEIDRIVSRTISYGAVTAILAVVFVATIIAVQAALSHVTSGQTIPVAVSTLVVFALFQPIRRRVQRLVDRRFDRARYDGERTALAFAERLRNEVDIATVNEELDRTVRDVLRPSAVMLWLRNSDPAPQSWMKRGTDG